VDGCLEALSGGPEPQVCPRSLNLTHTHTHTHTHTGVFNQ